MAVSCREITNKQNRYPERNHRSTQLTERAIQKLFRKFLHQHMKHFFKVAPTPAEPVELHHVYRNIKSSVTADDRSYSSINLNKNTVYPLTMWSIVVESCLVILSILMSNMLVHGYNASYL